MKKTTIIILIVVLVVLVSTTIFLDVTGFSIKGDKGEDKDKTKINKKLHDNCIETFEGRVFCKVSTIHINGGETLEQDISLSNKKPKK